jgi:glycosyltransferase involved in cell wall biosynthesis
MRVLWFASNPCSASKMILPGFSRGGWLASLEQELSKKDDIELYVAFYFSKKIEPFVYGNTRYYPMHRRIAKTKIGRQFYRMIGKENYERAEIENLVFLTNSINPDIIHVCGTEDNYGLIQNFTSIPVVVSIQGVINAIVGKYFSGVPQNQVLKHSSLKRRILNNTYQNGYSLFKKRSIREQDILKISKNIIGRTDWDRRIVKLLAPQSKYFIGNEILRESFYVKEWRKINFNNRIQIITTINQGLFKGFETIIKTAHLLLTYQNFSFEWIIVGLDKNCEIVKIVEKWLNIDSKSCNIRFLGNKNENEISDLLLEADIYCQVSHIENSPNSLCEALLIGMPVIASYAGGTGSLIINDEEGIIVQDGEPFVLAGSIIELSNDFQKAKKMGQTARQKALRRHNTTDIVNSLISTYQTIIFNKS